MCSSDKMTPNHFLLLSEVCSMLHYESVGQVHKKCYLILSYTFFGNFLLLLFMMKLAFLSFFFNSEMWIGGSQQSVEPRRFYLTGDIRNLYPFIQGLLEWPFSELFCANLWLWNQCKYIASNIFSCRGFIISCKILIITGVSNEKNKCINHAWNYVKMSQYFFDFFISNSGKIGSVPEFKIKFFK